MSGCGVCVIACLVAYAPALTTGATSYCYADACGLRAECAVFRGRFGEHSMATLRPLRKRGHGAILASITGNRVGKWPPHPSGLACVQAREMQICVGLLEDAVRLLLYIQAVARYEVWHISRFTLM